METVRGFTYLGDRVSVGCEAAVTAKTRCGWVNLREFGELLYGRRFPLKLEGPVYRSYVRPEILYGSETWWLKESEMGILRRTERSMMGAMCGLQLKDRKRSTDLVFMLDFSETLYQLAIANSVSCYGHVLRRENAHVLRRAIDFEVEGQRKKGRLKRTWKKQVEEESMRVGLRREDGHLRLKWNFWRKSDCCLVGVNLATLTC